VILLQHNLPKLKLEALSLDFQYMNKINLQLTGKISLEFDFSSSLLLYYGSQYMQNLNCVVSSIFLTLALIVLINTGEQKNILHETRKTKQSIPLIVCYSRLLKANLS